MDDITYELIRSRRKTLSLEMRPEGLLVRAPLRASERQIRSFVDRHRQWIKKHQQKLEQQRRQAMELPAPTEEELETLVQRARQYIPERVRYYALKVGVTYGRITIRNQKSRWGSCSSKGNLNFNCLLMLTPPEVIDSVVVHELCHRKEMNHSEAFYDHVLRVFPEYKRWSRWLKENGKGLMLWRNGQVPQSIQSGNDTGADTF